MRRRKRRKLLSNRQIPNNPTNHDRRRQAPNRHTLLRRIRRRLRRPIRQPIRREQRHSRPKHQLSRIRHLLRPQQQRTTHMRINRIRNRIARLRRLSTENRTATGPHSNNYNRTVARRTTHKQKPRPHNSSSRIIRQFSDQTTQASRRIVYISVVSAPAPPHAFPHTEVRPSTVEEPRKQLQPHNHARRHIPARPHPSQNKTISHIKRPQLPQPPKALSPQPKHQARLRTILLPQQPKHPPPHVTHPHQLTTLNLLPRHQAPHTHQPQAHQAPHQRHRPRR